MRTCSQLGQSLDRTCVIMRVRIQKPTQFRSADMRTSKTKPSLSFQTLRLTWPHFTCSWRWLPRWVGGFPPHHAVNLQSTFLWILLIWTYCQLPKVSLLVPRRISTYIGCVVGGDFPFGQAIYHRVRGWRVVLHLLLQLVGIAQVQWGCDVSMFLLTFSVRQLKRRWHSAGGVSPIMEQQEGGDPDRPPACQSPFSFRRQQPSSQLWMARRPGPA